MYSWNEDSIKFWYICHIHLKVLIIMGQWKYSVHSVIVNLPANEDINRNNEKKELISAYAFSLKANCE